MNQEQAKQQLIRQGHTLSCAYEILYGSGECICTGDHNHGEDLSTAYTDTHDSAKARRNQA